MLKEQNPGVHGLEERAMQGSLEGEAKKVKKRPGGDQYSKMHYYRINLLSEYYEINIPR